MIMNKILILVKYKLVIFGLFVFSLGWISRSTLSFTKDLLLLKSKASIENTKGKAGDDVDNKIDYYEKIKFHHEVIKKNNLHILRMNYYNHSDSVCGFYLHDVIEHEGSVVILENCVNGPGFIFLESGENLVCEKSITESKPIIVKMSVQD